MNIRPSRFENQVSIWALYRRVAAVPGGIARLRGEVSRSYVARFLRSAFDRGLTLIAENEEGRIIGEIHACSPELYCFSHVLSDLTIVVDPGVQGCGVGRKLFQRFLDIVSAQYPHIERIELITRESNRAAIRLYESLGFVREGRLAGRILNVDGTVECDIPMAWTRAQRQGIDRSSSGVDTPSATNPAQAPDVPNPRRKPAIDGPLRDLRDHRPQRRGVGARPGTG